MIFRLLELFSILALVQVSCNADPWPEPDPGRSATQNNGNSDDEAVPEKNKKKEIEDADADADSNSKGNKKDSNNDSSSPEEADSEGVLNGDKNSRLRIYCSAPGQDGLATLVGLPGALKQEDSLLIVGENKEESSVESSTDGSFAARIAAVPNEKLALTVVHQTTEESLGNISVGSNEDYPLSGQFLGSEEVDGGGGGDGIDGGSPLAIDIEISSKAADEMVTIKGAGSLLSEDFRIIAGNIDLNTGRSKRITCSPDCQFTLSIPGRSGDQIDIFMASMSDDLGYTNVQTIEVP